MRRRACLVAVLSLVVLGGCLGIVSEDEPAGDDALDDGVPTDDLNETDAEADAEDERDEDDWPPEDAPTAADFAFEDATDEVGLDYASLRIGAVNGNNGLYAVDADGDLQTDLLAIGGSEVVLFENVGGEFERTDAVPNVQGHVQGALFFDHDNDGAEDLLLLRRGETPVFLENDGDGEFEVRDDVGLDDEFVVPATASAADYTGNGCLDVFVAHYEDWLDEQPIGWQSTRPVEAAEDNGKANALYRGDCESFERVDEEAGIEGEHWSLATSFVDFTGNGYPDIHVGNDFYEDVLYTNQGDGTFEREYLGDPTDRNAMSSRAVDVTRNGFLDVFVTNIYYPRDRYGELAGTERQLFLSFINQRIGPRDKGNNLLVNTGDGFVDEGTERRVNEGGWGWASALEDFDSDGQVDVVHATQFEARFGDGTPNFVRPMIFAQHEGDFVRLNASAVGFGEGDERGTVGMDVDTSGAMDVAFGADNEAYRFYRNTGEQGNSLQVVVGPSSHDHTAIGATVEATVDDETQLRTHHSKSDYQSQDSRTLHFGVGDAEQVDELRVEWPDGTVATVEDVDVGQRVLLTPDGVEERVPYADA